MLQCRFCLGEVEDVDDDGIIECECGARFPVLESLFASGHSDDIPDDDDEWLDEDGHDVRGPEIDPADFDEDGEWIE
jgi:hypothetical protein